MCTTILNLRYCVYYFVKFSNCTSINGVRTDYHMLNNASSPFYQSLIFQIFSGKPELELQAPNFAPPNTPVNISCVGFAFPPVSNLVWEVQTCPDGINSCGQFSEIEVKKCLRRDFSRKLKFIFCMSLNSDNWKTWWAKQEASSLGVNLMSEIFRYIF